jgi:hypothetical protein
LTTSRWQHDGGWRRSRGCKCADQARLPLLQGQWSGAGTTSWLPQGHPSRVVAARLSCVTAAKKSSLVYNAYPSTMRSASPSLPLFVNGRLQSSAGVRPDAKAKVGCGEDGGRVRGHRLRNTSWCSSMPRNAVTKVVCDEAICNWFTNRILQQDRYSRQVIVVQ